MKVVLSARVEADLERRLRLSIDTFGARVAAKTFGRVDTFLRKFLPAHPKSGDKIMDGLFEVWISNTPFVVIYRLDEQAGRITVVGLFHAAQDRSGFDPDDQN
jgi:plasmid stabilization system protein ParE